MSEDYLSITTHERGLKELEQAIQCSREQIEKRGYQNLSWEANNVLLCSRSTTWEGEEYYYNPVKDAIWSQTYYMHLDDGKDCSGPDSKNEESLKAFVIKNNGTSEDVNAVLDLLKLCREKSASYREKLENHQKKHIPSKAEQALAERLRLEHEKWRKEFFEAEEARQEEERKRKELREKEEKARKQAVFDMLK